MFDVEIEFRSQVATPNELLWSSFCFWTQNSAFKKGDVLDQCLFSYRIFTCSVHVLTTILYQSSDQYFFLTNKLLLKVP